MSGKKPKHPKHDSAPKHNESPSQKETTNRHVYVEPGVQIDLVQDFREEYRANQKDNTSHSKKQLTWTIVSAILIFIYAGLTAWQGFSTKRSADAASSAASTADATLKASSLNFRLEQRPYLIVDSMNIINNPDKRNTAKPDALEMIFANVGQTPAFHVRFDPTQFIVTVQGAGNLNSTVIGISESTVGRDKIQRYAMPMVLPQLQRVEIHDGKRKLWVRGAVLYDDVFGCQHNTTFCAEYRPDGFRNCNEADGTNEVDRIAMCQQK